MCKVLIVHYSMYGHIYRMAEAVAEGVREVTGCEALIKCVPETLPDGVLEKMGALEAQKGMAHIPIAVVVGLPYAFAGQMDITEMSGCSPYGAPTITGSKGKRMPSNNELAGARFQGAHVARTALTLRG